MNEVETRYTLHMRDLRLRLAGLLVTLLLVACGDDDSREDPGGASPSPRAIGTTSVARSEALGPGATSEKALSAAFERVRPAVEEVLGHRFEDPVRFLPASTDRIEDLLTSETILFSKGMEERKQTLEAAADTLAAAKLQSMQLAPVLLAKIDTDTGEILVQSGAFKRLADTAPEFAGINTQPFLDLIIAHESVHIFQHRTFDLKTFAAGSRSPEKLTCRCCVMEGHAQYVTKRVAGKLGLEAEFALLRAVNSEVPTTIKDPLVRMMTEVIISTLGMSYIQGQEFFETVAAEVGYAKAVEVLFSTPPERLRSVTHPGEYLAGDEPASRIEEIVRQGFALFDEDRYTVTTVGLQSITLRTVLSLADPEEIEEAVGDFIEGAIIVGRAKSGGPGSMLTASIIVNDSEEAAERFTVIERKIVTRKDEVFSKPGGTAQIIATKYEDLEHEGKPGFSADKTVRVGRRDMHVLTVVLQRGPVVVEALAVNVDEDMKALIALAEKVLGICDALSK